jgi:hypothetical protein
VLAPVAAGRHLVSYHEIDERPARQSGSFSGRAQTSRGRLAMTRQAETGFTENSPAIYGWVKCHQHKIKSRQGRQSNSFVPDGTWNIPKP